MGDSPTFVWLLLAASIGQNTCCFQLDRSPDPGCILIAYFRLSSTGSTDRLARFSHLVCSLPKSSWGIFITRDISLASSSTFEIIFNNHLLFCGSFEVVAHIHNLAVFSAETKSYLLSSRFPPGSRYLRRRMLAAAKRWTSTFSVAFLPRFQELLHSGYQYFQSFF